MKDDQTEKELNRVAQELQDVLSKVRDNTPGAYLELTNEGDLLVKENQVVTAKVFDIADKAAGVKERFRQLMCAFKYGGEPGEGDPILWRYRIKSAARLHPMD